MNEVGYWIAPAVNINPHLSAVDDIISRIEEVIKVPITTKGRYRSLCEGRQLAAYIMHVKLGLSLASVGERLKIDHSTVSHAVKCIEILLELDKKFVARWKNIIDYTSLSDDINVTEPEVLQDESEQPKRCIECTAYSMRGRFCELRMIKCWDNKPISKQCRTYYLKKREL
jgi:hypothetical protein